MGGDSRDRERLRIIPPPLDDRPLPARTRMGQPAQANVSARGLVDINVCLDNAQYSKYHAILLAAGCLAMIGSGSQVFLTCVIQAFANCRFEMDSSDRTWLLCSVFILYPFGAVFIGWTADKWGRKWSLIFCLYMVLITGIIQIMASSWVVLLVARLIMGFFLPGVLNIPLVFWLEVSPFQHREEGMLTLLCLFASGAAYDFCIAALSTSLSEKYAYEIICGLAAFPTLLAVVFAHLTVESPRWLGVGSTLKATDVALRDYGYIPTHPAQDTPLDIYYMEQRGNICVLFKYLYCDINLYATLFSCSLFIEFGTILILPYMFYWDYCGMGFTGAHSAHSSGSIISSILGFFAKHGRSCSEIDYWSFLYLLVVSTSIIVGLVLGYFTQHYFGSRFTLITYSIISCIIYSFLDVCWSYVYTIVEMVAGMIFLMATQYSMWSNVLIQVPTFMRVSGVGYADAWGKIGALCGVAMCSEMGDRSLLDEVFWSFLVVGIFQIFFICLVSLESRGARVFDNLPDDPHANQPPPLCAPRPPPPPPPPHYNQDPPPPGYERSYYDY